MLFVEDDVVETTLNITTGLNQSTLVCKKGTRLRVMGESHNKLHPVSVALLNDASKRFAVSEYEIQKVEV